MPRAEPHRELRGREKPSHFGVHADLGLPLIRCVSFDMSLCLSEPQFPHLEDGDRTSHSWLLEVIRYKGRAIVTSRPRAFVPGRGMVNIIPGETTFISFPETNHVHGWPCFHLGGLYPATPVPQPSRCPTEAHPHQPTGQLTQ